MTPNQAHLAEATANAAGVHPFNLGGAMLDVDRAEQAKKVLALKADEVRTIELVAGGKTVRMERQASETKPADKAAESPLPTESPLTVPPDELHLPFVEVDEDISFPLPRGNAIDAYVVYVGFDRGAAKQPEKTPQKKSPAKKPPVLRRTG